MQTINQNKYNLSRGLTVTEILITSILLITVSSFIMPSLISWQQKFSINQQATKFIQRLRHAREQSITNKTMVTICPLDAKNHCKKKWDRKITIFEDRNQNKIKDMNEKIISSIKSAPNQIKRTYKRTAITFNQYGLSYGNNGTLILCLSKSLSRAIFVAATGRIRSAHDHNKDGIVENSRKQPLTCNE